MNPAELADRLVAELSTYDGCAVAFSGGVDSAVVLKAAALALGERAVGVIGIGPALAAAELNDARQLAAHTGIELVETATAEIERPGYVANEGDRCFHCKTELYTEVEAVARSRGLMVVANGANTDDAGDYRPGAKAASDFDVRSPLADCGLDKAGVRAVASHWRLSVADKPASPCLASRLAYGVPVTEERLRQVEQAEQFLRGLGLLEFRVRCHADELARIEVGEDEISRLASSDTRRRLVDTLTGLGFRYVTIDLAGFRSGSMNAVLPAESLGAWSTPPSR